MASDALARDRGLDVASVSASRARAMTLAALARAEASARETARARGGGSEPLERACDVEDARAPAGYRAALDGRDGEDHASTRHALDALRGGGERDWDAVERRASAGGVGASGGVGNAIEGGGSAMAVTYEATETNATGGSAASAIAFAKVGEKSVAIGDRAGNLVVMRCATDEMECARACETGAHDGEIVGADWSLNGARLVTSCRTGNVKVWNVTHTSKTTIQITSQCLVRLFAEITCVKFHAAQDDVVFVGTKMREVLVIDAVLGCVLEKLPMKATPMCLECNTSGNVIFAGDDEGQVNVLMCEARMKKTLSRSEGDAAVENPLLRVMQERSASQTERMSAVGHQRANLHTSGDSAESASANIRSGLNSMMTKVKKAVRVPKVIMVKTGYRLKTVNSLSGPSHSPVRAVRYCPFIEVMGGAALLSFQECGSVTMIRANDLPYSDFGLFTVGKARNWCAPNRGGGIASFTHGHSFDVPLLSACMLNRTVIYLLPSIPGSPLQATQFTDEIEPDSEEAMDIATASAWSYDSSELLIGYSSGKVVMWCRKGPLS